jgi:hypothetical protein
MKAKLENESKWKTKKGFDYIMKKENWNEHPKKPAQSAIDDLKIPYVVAMEDTKAKLKQAIYNPANDGKADFQSKVTGPQTFSDPNFFKTVFISGEDMDKELAEVRKKELEEFDKKVVVKNKHFYVDSLVKQSHQIDKYKSIRKEPVQKIGLRLSVKKTRELVARQILAGKLAPEAPVSALSLQEQYMNG